MDSSESPLSTSPSLPSSFSPQRHFYLAVDRLQFKMVSNFFLRNNQNSNFSFDWCINLTGIFVQKRANFLLQETLVDLLGMVGRRPWLTMVVCCSTRDELDAVCSNVSNLSSYVNVSCLYSDLSEVERAQILDNFRRATGRWNRMGKDEIGRDEGKEEERKSNVIVVTDACLPLVGSGESPVSARILINYELPSKKETYTRRMATCLSSDGIVINMVVGGEVVILKTIEESSGLVIAEMPIHIFELM